MARDLGTGERRKVQEEVENEQRVESSESERESEEEDDIYNQWSGG